MPILRSSSPDDARRAISHIMQRNDSYAGQSHTKSPVTNRAPVTDDTALLTVSPPSKPRRPSWPPQVVHMDSDTSHSQPPVLPYTVPSFASDTPGPSFSTPAQQSVITSTHPKYLSSHGRGVNESGETYPLTPDSATSLSGAELSLTHRILPPTAKGAVTARSNSDLSARTADIGSHLYTPTGSGHGSSDGRRWTKGASLPTSVVPLYY